MLNDLRTENRLHWHLGLYDAATGAHSDRVGWITGLIARELGLGDAEVRALARAARLHDIGKLSVPCHLLVKAGRLSDDERALMRRHPTLGVARMAGLIDDPLTLSVIGGHHERWDGGGYPQRLAGEQIPLAARIVAVADVYASLREKRSYKPAWSHAQALDYVQAQSGAMFDPAVVAALVASLARGPIAITRASR